MASEPYTVGDFDEWIRQARNGVLLPNKGHKGSHVDYQLPDGTLVPGLDPLNTGKRKHHIGAEHAKHMAHALGMDRNELRSAVIAFHGRNANSKNRRPGKFQPTPMAPPPPAKMSLTETFLALKKIEARISSINNGRRVLAEKRLFQLMRDAELIANELLNVTE